MPSPQPLALRSGAVNEFIDQIDGVGQAQVFALPDLHETVNHQGKITAPSFDMEPGFYIDLDSRTDVIRLPDTMPDNLAFRAQPGHRFGRERSQHKVFFGKFMAEWQAYPSAAREAQVAIKALPERTAALGELAMFQYMRSLGIPTFEPHSVLISDSPDQKDHLLTHFDKAVATMDTVDWRELDAGEKWAQVSFAVDTLSYLHSHVLFHGDIEFKNVAFREKGQLMIIDPELMVSALDIADAAMFSKDDDVRMRSLITLRQRMGNDFTSLCSSVDQFIYGTMSHDERPKTEGAIFKDQLRHVFRPYRLGLEEQGSPYLPVLIEAYQAMVHERKQRLHNLT